MKTWNFFRKNKVTQLSGTLSFLVLAGMSQISCTKDVEGQYEDPTKVEIVNQDWNDTDFRKTSQKLIKELLEKPFLKQYKAKHQGKNPVIVVDTVVNKTPEHIDTAKLTDYITDELINSQEFDFVADDMREKIIKEMTYQEKSGYVQEGTKARMGKQTGVNFFMRGNIAGERPSNASVTVITYTVFLQLVDIETSKIVWSGRHEIKKSFDKKRWGF